MCIPLLGRNTTMLFSLKSIGIKKKEATAGLVCKEWDELNMIRFVENFPRNGILGNKKGTFFASSLDFFSSFERKLN